MHNKAHEPLISRWVILDLRNAPTERAGFEDKVLKRIRKVTTCNCQEIVLLFEERDQSICRDMVELKAIRCYEWLIHPASITYELDKERTLCFLNGVVATFGADLSIEVLQVGLHCVL